MTLQLFFVFFSITSENWPFPLRQRDLSLRPADRWRHYLHRSSRAHFLVPGPNSFTQPHRACSISLPHTQPTVGNEFLQFTHGPVDMADSVPPLTLQRTSHTRNVA